MSLLAPALSAVILFAAATMAGTASVRKIIEMREARHELRQGSASQIRRLASWAVVGFWPVATWFCATVIGDWGATGDLPSALDRTWLRLYILLEIASAFRD